MKGERKRVYSLISVSSGGGTEIRLGGAGVRGCEAANYPRKASAYEG